MSTIPTPRADAVSATEGNWDTKFFRMENFARTLERELIAEREKVRVLRDELRRLRNIVERAAS